MKNITKLITLTAVILFSQVVSAEKYEVSQKNKAFSVEKLEIKVGDVVSFPNKDPFFHNIFSLSPDKTFDLGSYKKGETKTVTFDKAGTVEVECAIHPQMFMVIEVK